MEHCQDDMRKLSMELKNVFDISGFNEYARQFKYTIDPILGVISYDDEKIAGSMAEGTYMDTSDRDIMLFNKNKLLVGYEPKYAVPNTPYLQLKRANSTPAGYTKLQIYLNGKPCHKNDIIDLEYYFNHEIHVDSHQQCFLSNLRNGTQTENDKYLNSEYHGPASTFELNPLTLDAVLAYESEIIPNDLSGWFERTIQKNWPSRTTRYLFKSMGCCYVGKGHSNSSEQDLEWRISPTRQELYLMLNFNSTQFRCYIVLKIIKQIIQRPSDDGISSYLFKTALFYTIENNNSDIWQPENLIECVLKCLRLLLLWVKEKKCPNYFLPEENMLETKRIDKTVIKKLEYILGLPSICLTIRDYILSVIRNSRTETTVINQLVPSLKISLLNVQTDLASPTEQIDKMEHFIKLIKSSPRDSIQIFESFVSPHKINMDIALAMITEKLYQLNRHKHLKTVRRTIIDTDKGVISYLQDKSKKTHQDYEYGLKLASIAAAQRKYSMCDKLIQSVYEMAITIKTICFCKSLQQVIIKDKRFEYYRSLTNMVNVVKYSNSDGKRLNAVFIKSLLQQFTMCLKFYDGEYDAGMVIPPLHFEAYKTVGMPPEMVVIPTIRYSEDIISIHHAAYIYCLQFKNSKMLNKKGDMCIALEKLEHMNLVGLQEWKYCHPDTSLNLLGHIYTTKGWYRLALQCLKRSWKMLPNYNAAKWHTMFMLFGYTMCMESSQK